MRLPVEVTDGRYGSEIDSSGTDRDASLKPSKHIQTYGWHLLDSQLVQTVLAGVVGCLTVRPPLPLYTTVPLMILKWL